MLPRTEDGGEAALSRHVYFIHDCFADPNDGHTDSKEDGSTTPHSELSSHLVSVSFLGFLGAGGRVRSRQIFVSLQKSFPNPASAPGQTQWQQRIAA